MAISERRGGVVTLPNLLSLVRLALAPVFIVVSSDIVRMAILIVAVATEWLDGWLARHLGQTTRTGELLDPTADRLFVLSALAAMIAQGRLAAWELALLLFRDVFTALGGAVVALLHLPVALRARRPGKWVTTLQLLTLALLIVAPAYATGPVVLTGVAGVVAAADYLRFGVVSLRGARAQTH
jgi:CDP-diacylglycerol---glycerol-3-phosphate 3-phosphatidyltransferase